MTCGQGPHVIDPGGSNPWSNRSIPRRRDAGEVRDGGESAFCHSGNQMDGGRHLRVAEVEPRLLVVVVGLGVAGVDDGELGCGGGRSGAVGNGVAGR